MDVMMPEMDRLTAARIIRGMKGTDAGKIPIFAMNASAFPDVVKAGRRAGMNDIISVLRNEFSNIDLEDCKSQQIEIDR